MLKIEVEESSLICFSVAVDVGIYKSLWEGVEIYNGISCMYLQKFENYQKLTSYNEHQPCSSDAAKLPEVLPQPPRSVLENLKHFPSFQALQREI